MQSTGVADDAFSMIKPFTGNPVIASVRLINTLLNHPCIHETQASTSRVVVSIHCTSSFFRKTIAHDFSESTEPALVVSVHAAVRT
jgi:hypothetical protein